MQFLPIPLEIPAVSQKGAKMAAEVSNLPAFLTKFAVTLQEAGERPYRGISAEPGDGGIPADTVNTIQYLYDTGQKLTVSFKGEDAYEGLKGESAAKRFVNDAKDSAPHITARKEHSNGVTVAASADGIVVTVNVGKKRGRTPGSVASDASTK
jgi:hypothetical protein